MNVEFSIPTLIAVVSISWQIFTHYKGKEERKHRADQDRADAISREDTRLREREELKEEIVSNCISDVRRLVDQHSIILEENTRQLKAVFARIDDDRKSREKIGKQIAVIFTVLKMKDKIDLGDVDTNGGGS